MGEGGAAGGPLEIRQVRSRLLETDGSKTEQPKALAILAALFYLLLCQFIERFELVAHFLPFCQKLIENLGVGAGGAVKENHCPRMDSS